jgi:hypothetical protein
MDLYFIFQPTLVLFGCTDPGKRILVIEAGALGFDSSWKVSKELLSSDRQYMLCFLV